MRLQKNSLVCLLMVGLFCILVSPSRSFVSAQTNPSPTPTSGRQVISAVNAFKLKKFVSIVSPNFNDSLTNPVWSPDSSRLAVSGLDHIFLFKVSDFSKPERSIPQHSPSYLTFSPDGLILAAQSADTSDRTIHVFDVSTGTERYSLHESALSMQISPSGKFIGIQTVNSSIELFDLLSGSHRISLPATQLYFTFGHDDSTVITIEQSEQGSTTNTLWLWNTSTGEKVKHLAYNSNPTSITPSSQKDVFGVTFADATLVLWDSKTDTILQKLTTEFGLVKQATTLQFSVDSHFLAAIGPGMISVWQLPSGKLLRKFDNLDPDLYGGVFNKDGTLLTYWDFTAHNPIPDNTTRLWGISEGKEINVLSDARDPQFSPDGTMLATWGKSVEIWTVQ